MPKRLLLILAMSLAPFAASAETVQSSDAPGGLGPQSTTSGAAGGSSADAGALQPSAPSALQSTTGDSSGLTAPSSLLQAPASSEAALKVLATEADGPPQSLPPDASFPWGWLILALVIGFLVTGISVVLRHRRRFARTDQDQL